MEVEEIYEYILQKVPKLALEKSSPNWKRNIRNMLKQENKVFEKVGFSCWSLKSTPTNDSSVNKSQATRTVVIEPTSNSQESKSEPKHPSYWFSRRYKNITICQLRNLQKPPTCKSMQMTSRGKLKCLICNRIYVLERNFKLHMKYKHSN